MLAQGGALAVLETKMTSDRGDRTAKANAALTARANARAAKVAPIIAEIRATVTNAIAFVKRRIGQRLEIVLDRPYSRVKGFRRYRIGIGIVVHGARLLERRSGKASYKLTAAPISDCNCLIVYILDREGLGKSHGVGSLSFLGSFLASHVSRCIHSIFGIGGVVGVRLGAVFGEPR
jgi:hypothetical protein